MSTDLLIVHISDLHVSEQSDAELSRLEALGSRVANLCVGKKKVVFVLSGDLAYSGKREEYATLKSSLDKCASALRVSAPEISDISWIAVPGNHDGAFKGSKKSRQHAIDAVLKHGESAIDDSVIETCVEPMAPYFDFHKEISRVSPQFHDKLLCIQEIAVDTKTVSFWSFNASWLSQVPETQGKLTFPLEKYRDLLKNKADLRIAVMHHPLNWYVQDSYHPLREFIYKNFCILVTGHEHVANAYSIESINSGNKTILLESGAFFPHEKHLSTEFSAYELSVDESKLTQHNFKWVSEQSIFIEDDSKKQSKSIFLSGQRDFEINSSMMERLEDLGAPFSNSSKLLRLSDLYIEPRLKLLDVDEKSSNGQTWREILPDFSNCQRKLIRGDDHFGKTSFLHRIYLQEFGNGFVPLLVTARDLSTGSENVRRKRIEEAVTEQYGASAIDLYNALPREKKLLLIDDLDQLGAKDDAYARCLQFAKDNYLHVLATVNERFDFSVIGSSLVANLASEYAEYRILGFSYSMRTDLISKWYTRGNSDDSKSLERKIHAAQDHIDSAIGKAVLPSTAFNTLMVLQALEATQKSQIVDAGIAQHYDILIRQRLHDNGVAANKIDGIYTYLSYLAWWMHKHELLVLDLDELTKFNNHFSEKVHLTNLTERVQLLARARIVQVTEDSYKFRYPAARYFFLSHYIADQIEEDNNLRTLVENACRHLYLKDNANLIVFLTSRIASKWILKEVVGVLASLLSEIKPFNLKADLNVLNSWVSDTARLVLDDQTDQAANRRQQRERDEEAQRRDENDQPAPVDSVKELDIFTQLNLVFKTCEILGLILKTRVESLNNELKREILGELFDGPLRAVSFFLTAVNEHPEALVEMISKLWAERRPDLEASKRQLLAQKYVYYSLGAYSQALIQRQGEIIGSPDLKTYVSSLVDRVSSSEATPNAEQGRALTYRLVAVATRLAYPGEIPATEIHKLAKDLKDNSFGFSLLQGLVANHLYMFAVSYDQRQSLAAAVGIDLKKQISLEMTNSDKKSQSARVFQRRHPKGLIQRLIDSFVVRNEAALSRIKDSEKK